MISSSFTQLQSDCLPSPTLYSARSLSINLKNPRITLPNPWPTAFQVLMMAGAALSLRITVSTVLIAEHNVATSTGVLEYAFGEMDF